MAHSEHSYSPESPVAYSSLAELRTAHADLLKLISPSQPMDEVQLERVRNFLERGAATGARLDNVADREMAQGLLDYWKATLYGEQRSRQASSRQADEPDKARLPATVLADFDPKTIQTAIVAADRWLEQLSECDVKVARRIMLRLVRLAPFTHAFEPAITSRAALDDVDPSSKKIDEILRGLAEAGVVYVTKGASPEANQIALRSNDLITTWGAFASWLAERLQFRESVERWSIESRIPSAADVHQTMSGKVPPVKGNTIYPDQVDHSPYRDVEETAKRLSRVLLGKAGIGTGSSQAFLEGDELEEVRNYHDRNSLERSFIEQSWFRERRRSQLDRKLMWLFGALSLIALTCFLSALWFYSGEKAAERARKQAQDANERALDARAATDRAYTTALIHLLTDEDIPYSHHLAKKLLIVQTLAQLVSADQESWPAVKSNWTKLEKDLLVDPAVEHWFKKGFFPHEIEGQTIRQRIDRIAESLASAKANRRDLPKIGKYLGQYVYGYLEGDPSIKAQWYEVARSTTSELAKAANENKAVDAVAGFRDLFWRLYLAEMVLVENDDVEKQMVEFGKLLAEWSAAPDHMAPRDLKKKMEYAQVELESALFKDLPSGVASDSAPPIPTFNKGAPPAEQKR